MSGGPSDPNVPQISYEEDEEASNQSTVLHDFVAQATSDASDTQLRRRPTLVIVGGLATGRVHPLRTTVTTVGRSLACDIVIEDGGVSRKHAQLTISPERGSVRMDDLGSSNGLVYQGRRIRSVELRDGDRVSIGEAAISILHMEDVSSEEAAPHSMGGGRKLVAVASAAIDSTQNNIISSSVLSRSQFLEGAHREYDFAQKHQSPLALAFFSIDRLHSLTDQYGSDVEALLLARVVQMIRDILDRPDAKIGRLASDRVALIVPELTRVRVVDLCTRICSATASVQYRNTRIAFGLSAGVGSPAGPNGFASLLEETELNMHRAAAAGGSRCVG